MSLAGEGAALDYGSLLDWSHPLNAGLVRAYQVLPGRWGGTRWIDLAAGAVGTLTGMASPPSATSGIGPTARPGAFGQLNCDGTNDYVALGTSLLPLNQPWSVTLWLKITDLAANSYLALGAGYNDNAHTYALLLHRADHNGLVLQWTDTGTGAIITPNPTRNLVANVWTHVALVVLPGQSTVQLYQDGTLNMQTTTFPMSPAQPTGQGWALGSWGSAPASLFWKGALDALRLYRRALSAVEVLALSQDSPRGASSLPRRVARWRLVPGLTPGAVTVTASAETLTLSTADPTVTLGATTVTPASIALRLLAIDPEVLLGGPTVTPPAEPLTLSTSDPTVSAAMTLTPAPAALALSTVNPGVTLGALMLAPGVVTLALSAVDPAVYVGDLLIVPAPSSLALSTVNPSVQLGATAVTPVSIALRLATLDPVLIFGPLTLTPGPATLALSTGDPQVFETLALPSVSWLAAMGATETAAGRSAAYAPVLYVTFPTLSHRTFTTRVGGSVIGEGLISRFDAGGVGAITRDLDELTDTIRLGGASFTLPNVDNLVETFGVGSLTQAPVRIDMGSTATGDRFTVFTGIVDRFQVTEDTLQVSAVPGTLQDRQPLSLTVREIANIIPGAFPELPPESADTVVPLWLGQAIAVPLIRVGRNLYLSGFGVTSVRVVRDNNEEILHHGERPLVNVQALTVRGRQLKVAKVQYQVENGHTISMDINQNEGNNPTNLGAGGAWPNADPQPYEFTPRPRHNMFNTPGVDGSFETSVNTGFGGYTTGIGAPYRVDIQRLPLGSGKVHAGRSSMRIRSSNATDTGDHRYAVTFTRTLIQNNSTAFHLSFWYVAGTFLGPGRPETEQVSSQVSIKINSLPWTPLAGSPSFDQMVEFTTTVVALDGVINFQLKCEGLSAARSADIYLDDFVCWGEDPVHPFVDQGIHPTSAIRRIFEEWLPTTQVNWQSLTSASSTLVNWKFVSLYPGGTDAITLLHSIAQQCKCALYKDRFGVYQVLALDQPQTSIATFTTSRLVVHSLSRVAAPSEGMFSSFAVRYSLDNGLVLLTPEGSNLEASEGGAALLLACQALATLLGGDHRLAVPSDLILDRATAIQALAWAVTRHGLRGDLLAWRTALDALPLDLTQAVTMTHRLVPSGQGLMDLVGWHFLPNVMQVELVGRARSPSIPLPPEASNPVAHPINLFTPAGVPVGAQIPNFVTPAPNTLLDLTSVVLSALTPSTSGTFAVSLFASAIFTPAPGFTGLTTALYSMADSAGHRSNDAIITITVGLIPQLVVANPDTATTEMNTPVTLALLDNDSVVLPGVLAPTTVDLDPDTPGRQVTWTDPDHGTFTVDDLGTVTLTPVTDYLGDAVATYTVADDLGNISNPATITVTVVPVPPTLRLSTSGPALPDLGGWTLLQRFREPSDAFGDTGIHILNGFAYFAAAARLVAVTGDPTLGIGGSGEVPLIGLNDYNDVWTASRLLAWAPGAVASVGIVGRTSFFGSNRTTTGGGNVTTAKVCVAAYGDKIYVAHHTSLEEDDALNGPPVIHSLANLTNYTVDGFSSTWVQEHEFASSVARIGAMAVYDGLLYAALEPATPGTDALDIWTYNGATWAFQASLGTAGSRLRSLCVYAGALYAGADGLLVTSTGGAWTTAHAFTGRIDSQTVRESVLYVNLLDGTDRKIWTWDGATATLVQTFANETSPLTSPMVTGPDGNVYVGVREGTATRVYVYDGATWEVSRDWGSAFLGVSALFPALDGRVYAALARRLYAQAPPGSSDDAEIWYHGGAPPTGEDQEVVGSLTEPMVFDLTAFAHVGVPDGAPLDLDSLDVDIVTAGVQTTFTNEATGTWDVTGPLEITFTPNGETYGAQSFYWTISSSDGQVSAPARIYMTLP